MTSFDFVWNKQGSVNGKVLARKRKKPAESNEGGSKKLENILQKNKVHEKPNVDKFKKDVALPNPPISKKKVPFKNTRKLVNLEQNTPPENPLENDSKRLVKRKKKKDKLAAAELLRLGQKPTPVPNQDRIQHSLFSEKHRTKNISNISGASVVEQVFSSDRTFSYLDIHKYIVSNLEKNNFTTLTNVQEKAIPVILKGGNVLIRSQTGSGKTLAYTVPIVDALQSITPRLERNQGVQALIIVPTRELALQTHEIISKICTFQWVVIGHLCGGENRNTEKSRLRKGVHILVATPGRLLDHILHTSSFKVNNVRCLVLDEADRLLDMGFKKDIIKIVQELDQSKKNCEYDPLALLRGETPKEKSEEVDCDDLYCLRNPKSPKRQVVLLSATLTKGIAELAEFTMKEHTYIDALDESSNINPDHMVIPKTVRQEYMITFVKHRLFTLASVLVAKSKENCKILVFMATSQMVDYHYQLFSNYLAKMPINRGKVKSGDVLLLDEGGESDDEEEIVMDAQFFKLHGSMEQSKRKEEFSGFRKAKRGILLCTDVAARGIDVPQADYVIQYTGPQTDEDYLHRVGRTGRVDRTGTALIFLTHDEQEYVTHLQKHKVFLKERNSSEFSNHLCDLMEEVEEEKAASALQRRFEEAVSKDKELYKLACFAHSSWSRFYNSYPAKLRNIFNFQMVNLGHYVTSFAIKDTPSHVAKVVRGQVANVEPKRLNRKLAIHEDDQPRRPKQAPKRKINSISLRTSEYSSGLDFKKKKKKN
ncbi:hypothetical protein HHI36_012652 [Cryptolaemus montrouzieri]|uniref:ATP-dependent RNA helicase n=1 Tax=Cryptolaemus montrouzieri TaxID=559131 RepID=A0ABD2NG94_9CUCU